MNRSAPALLALLLAFPLLSAGRELVVDQKRSFIHFTARATIHKVDGRVISFEADVGFPYADEFPTTATLRFGTNRLTTDHEDRDRDMLRWLEAEKYPEVVFELEELEGTGSTRLARGVLTLHGVSRGVLIPVTLTTVGPVVTLTGETEINTTDFRLPILKQAVVMKVSPYVEVTFNLVGRLE